MDDVLLVNGPKCRLCWGDEDDGKLISPCNCAGSMQFVHFHCLSQWLEVQRQQARQSRTSIRCEVCKGKYKQHAAQDEEGHNVQLIPGMWHDPYAIASILHGTFRAYVSLSGLWTAYSIYRSLNPSAANRSSNSTSNSRIGNRRGRWWAFGVQQRHTGPMYVGLPFGSGRQHFAPISAQQQQQQLQSEVLSMIKERFNKATMVQVHWYTALLAITPHPPNSDAFAGMALGATIGGMMAQLVFLPVLGSGRLAALGHGCKLLLRCLVRLLAAEACQPKGYRVLAALLRAWMQLNCGRLIGRLRHRVPLPAVRAYHHQQ